MGAAYQAQENNRNLGEAMAAIPESVDSSRVTGNTEQSLALAEQTADFADTPGGIPDSEIATQQSAGQTRMSISTTDWKSWEDQIMATAGKMGPEAVKNAQAHIIQTQQAAFEKSASAAMKLLRTNPQAAARQLEEAYSNMPDGNSAQITVGADGKLLVQVIDEETGQPEGEPTLVGPEEIADFIEMTRDPVAWNDAISAGRLATLEAAEEKRRFDEETAIKVDAEKRLGEGLTEDIRSNKAAEGNAANKVTETGRHNIVTEGLKGVELANAKAQNKVNNTLDALEFKLKQHENVQAGAQRELDRDKTVAEIRLNEAKSRYYANGGTAAGEATYFKKRNDILQRLNTSASSMADADEAMSKHQRRKAANEDYEIPPAAVQAYAREQNRYKMIKNMWDQVARDELAANQAVPSRQGIPSTQVDHRTEADFEAKYSPTGSAIPVQAGDAPPEAVQMLAADPSPQNKAFFKETFGYLPEGM